MSANYLLEKSDHTRALQQFEHSKDVYKRLYDLGAKSAAVDRSTQILYEERILQIEPNIKYCTMIKKQSALAGISNASAAIGKDAYESPIHSARPPARTRAHARIPRSRSEN
jgi:hypothetical protein